MDLNQLLSDVQSGKTDVRTAEALLTQQMAKNQPGYDNLGFARVDHRRRAHSGFPEVIFCPNKKTEHIVRIAENIAARGENVLATRAGEEVFEAVRKALPDARYHEDARIVEVRVKAVEQKGCIAVCTAGTADIPVAEEAAVTAEAYGCVVRRFYDVGVAGIHRLFDSIGEIRAAKAVITVAGMEGALASVVGGLVDKPVIAVPTSVGYGANFGGLSALLTMLNSCSSGIGVVNIDNGFGAGVLAAKINLMAKE